MHEIGRIDAFATDLSRRLRSCGTVDELCEMVGHLCHEMLPEDAIVVSLWDPAQDVITIRSLHGVGGLVDTVLSILEVDPRRMSFRVEDMSPADRARYCSGHLERVPGGIHELLTHRVPRLLCQATERALRVQAIYVVGFAQGDEPRGGLTILRRSHEEPDQRPLIELLSSMVSLAIRQRQAEHDRSELETRLQEAQRLEAIGKLAGGVAHDFNNTLQGARTLVELMQQDLPANHPHQQSLLELVEAVDHATRMTRSLLDIGRRQHLVLESLDLVELLGRLERLLRSTLRDDVRVEVRSPQDPVPIQGDAVAMQRVLVNLAINAQDAMPRGGRLELVLSRDEDAGLAVLYVRDSGVGMAPDVARRAFEPFFTTKQAGQGTGLGLATVYGIVQQHQGQITLSTRPGQGTTFTLLLPLGQAQARRPAAGASPRTPTPSRAEGWVLLVDDEARVRRLVGRHLRRQGWEVLEAAHGVEALERAAVHPNPPSLLITDISMPEMSGWELLERMREQSPSLPVVLVSGYAADLAGEGHLETGVRFLAKPFSIHDLDGLMAELLGTVSVD